MPTRLLQAVAFLATLALFGGCAETDGGGKSSAAAQSADQAALSKVQSHPSVAVCDSATDKVHCHAKVRVQTSATKAASSAGSEPGYGPSDLASAYNIPASAKSGGRTVAIVDAYDDPTAESDLAMYRSEYGLSPCTTANGCFKKVNEHGAASPLPQADPGWSGEISLDLDMVSAICPDCKILLVEASTASMADLGTSVNTAATLGAVAISNSYGADESSGDVSWSSLYYKHPGVLVTASTGDEGYAAGPAFPAASQYVLAVGGTTLTRSSSSRGWAEAAWDEGGAGCTAYTSKPTWQTDSLCANRTLADVAAVGDPDTGVAVVQSGAWHVYGGTSVASPLIAALFTRLGIAAQSASACASSSCTPYPYAHRLAFNDVTLGSDGSCNGSLLCNAGTGYDGPTGLGTPNSALLLGPLVSFQVTGSESSALVAAGGSTSLTYKATMTGSYNAGIAFSVNSLPDGITATFSPSSLTAAGSTSLSITADPSTIAGTYALTVVAAGSGITVNLLLSLTVGPVPTFTASTDTVDVTASESGEPVTVNTVDFSAAVKLTATGLPTGVTATFSSATIASPGTEASVLTVKAAATATPGTYSATLTATGGGIVETLPLTIVVAAVPTFAVTLSEPAATVMVGTSTEFTVTTTTNASFNSAVAIGVTGIPTGTTLPAESIPVPGAGTATMTVTVGANTKAGTYSLSVSGSAGGVTHRATFSLIVTPIPNFTLALSKSALSAVVGTSPTITATVAANSTFDSAVAITTTGMPSGVAVASSSTNAPGSGHEVLTFVIDPSATPGVYPLTVTATGNEISQALTFTLTVEPTPTFTLATNSDAVTVAPGSPGSILATTTGNSSFKSAVTVRVTGMPTGVTVSSGSVGTSGSGSVTLKVTAASTAAVGSYTLTVTATGGGVTQTVEVTLTVT